MGHNQYPEIITAFLDSLSRNLESYEATLKLTENLLDNKQPALFFRIENAAWDPTLIIHQTLESSDTDYPEYRVRINISFPEELTEYLQDKVNIINRYVLFSSVINFEQTIEVVSQSILNMEDLELTSYMMSIAAVYGATTVTESFKNLMEGKSDDVDVMSAWTDLDFEQIHYDYAHLGAATLSKRHWSMLSPFGRLEFDANHNNPYWKAGLLSLQYYNKKSLGVEDEVSANDLNRISYLFDDQPLYGAWVDDDDYFVFVTFIPNFMKSVPGMADHLVNWFIRRYASISEMITLVKNLNADRSA